MNRMKLWFEQTMTISFAIFVGIIIEGLVYCVFFGEDLAMFSLSWMQLLSVILTGTLCSVLTVIFLIGPDIPKNKYIVRIVLHCLGLYLIVSLFGWFFKWFIDLTGFIMVTILFFLVYVFVWAVSLWLHKRDDYKINKALDDIRDEE